MAWQQQALHSVQKMNPRLIKVAFKLTHSDVNAKLKWDSDDDADKGWPSFGGRPLPALKSWLEEVGAVSGDTMLHLVLRQQSSDRQEKLACCDQLLSFGVGVDVQNDKGDTASSLDQTFWQEVSVRWMTMIQNQREAEEARRADMRRLQEEEQRRRAAHQSTFLVNLWAARLHKLAVSHRPYTELYEEEHQPPPVAQRPSDLALPTYAQATYAYASLVDAPVFGSTEDVLIVQGIAAIEPATSNVGAMFAQLQEEQAAFEADVERLRLGDNVEHQQHAARCGSRSLRVHPIVVVIALFGYVALIALVLN